jgi:hypothetical protein
MFQQMQVWERDMHIHFPLINCLANLKDEFPHTTRAAVKKLLEAEVELQRQTISPPVCHVRSLFDNWGFLAVGHPLWREDGFVIYSYNCFWALPEQSLWGPSPAELRPYLLSHLRLPQPEGPGPRIYFPQEQGSPDIRPGTGISFIHLLRLAWLRWRYSNPPTRVWRSYFCLCRHLYDAVTRILRHDATKAKCHNTTCGCSNPITYSPARQQQQQVRTT